MQTCWRLEMVSPTWTFSQPKITMKLIQILEFSLTFCWGICLWTDRNLRWWCFNSNWDILFNPHPNLSGVPWVFLPVLSVMITIVGELIKKMLPTVCWYDMRAILLQHLGKKKSESFCFGTLSPGVKDVPYWGSDLHHMKFNYVQVVSSRWSIWFRRIKDLLSNLSEFRSAWAVFIFSFSSDSNSEDKNQNWYCTVDEHDVWIWFYISSSTFITLDRIGDLYTQVSTLQLWGIVLYLFDRHGGLQSETLPAIALDKWRNAIISNWISLFTC